MENKMKANLPKVEQDKLDKIFEIEDLYETESYRLKRLENNLANRWEPLSLTILR